MHGPSPVRRVIEALDHRGGLDSMLVMFTNDNGGVPITSNGPFRGFKSHYREGGVRGRAAMHWPGQIPTASVSNKLLHAVDLFPTFARLAGERIDSGLPLDRHDAWDAIAKGGPSPREEVVHSLEVIRVGDWKLIEEGASYFNWRDQPLQLFNIRHDAYGETNPADSQPTRCPEAPQQPGTSTASRKVSRSRRL